MISRRQFLAAVPYTAIASLVSVMGGSTHFQERLCVAQYSFRHKFNNGSLKLEQFPDLVRTKFNVTAIEWVNTLLQMTLRQSGLNSLVWRMNTAGMESHSLRIEKPLLRHFSVVRDLQSIEYYKPWIEVAHRLGCQYLRVGAIGPVDMQSNRWGQLTENRNKLRLEDCAASIAELLDEMRGSGLILAVENSLDYSSRAEWLVGLINYVGDPRFRMALDYGSPMSIQPVLWPSVKNANDNCRILAPATALVTARADTFHAWGMAQSTEFFRQLSMLSENGYRGNFVVDVDDATLNRFIS